MRDFQTTYGPVEIDYRCQPHRIKAVVRFDDSHNNGYKTFSITGEICKLNGRVESAGCLHEEIARSFPALAPFIRWHLFDTAGSHVVENAVYLAGERDCWGGLKGEPRAREYYIEIKTPSDVGLAVEWPNEENRLMRPKVLAFKTRQAARKYMREFLVHGKIVDHVTLLHDGKERELDAARKAAYWPEATDEQLTAPGLRERLEARAPLLQELLRTAVESLGFVY